MRLEEKVVYQGGRMGIRDSLGVLDQHVHTFVLKMNNPQGPTVEHKEVYSILCTA